MVASSEFTNLFSPLAISAGKSELQLRNRIVVPGHNSVFMTVTGPPTDRIHQYWLTKAQGGAAMIITHLHDVAPRSTEAENPTLLLDESIEQYKKISNSLHAEGTKFLIQLNHVGGEGSSRLNGGALLAPSAIRPTRNQLLPTAGETPHEMDLENIERIVAAFREAASRASQADFDGVEIQAEVSFLIAQFMSPQRNLRADQYGGSFKNRMRFAKEVISAVRQGLGNDKVIGIRISGDEFLKGGINQEEAVLIAKELESTGILDLIHVGAGPGGSAHIPPTYHRAGSFAYLSEGIRRAVALPVLSSQRINDPSIAEHMLREGISDLVAMNRAIMADPEMPLKAMQGRVDEIRHCIACNECISRNQAGMPIACTMNAEMGREASMPVTPARITKNVMIVGGGPAGLECARVAALRGHNVTLFEKNSKLGGQALIAARAPGREDFDEVYRYFSRQMELLGVQVNTNFKVTTDTITATGPNVIVIATGSVSPTGEHPGGTVEIATVRQVLSGEIDCSNFNKILIVDEDHSIKALSAADFLSNLDCDVELLTGALYAGAQTEFGTLQMVYERVLKKSVIIRPLTAISMVDGRTVVAINVLSEEETPIPDVDLIVTAGLSVAEDSLYHASLGLVDEIYLIGDALAPRKMIDAILDGARTARQI